VRVRRRRWRRLRRSYKGLRCVSGCAATGTRTQTWTGRLDLEWSPGACLPPWPSSLAALPSCSSCVCVTGLLESQTVRVQIEPLSLAPQKRAQSLFPGSLAVRGARIPRLGSFGLLAWLHIR
jgi:hypothetical protein